MQAEINIGLKINRGDFDKIYESYFNPLCAFAYKFVPDVAVVEDFAQEVFVGFWEKRTDFNELPAIKSYLYTAIRNKCLNYLKHLSVEQKHEKNLVQELESEHQFENHVIEEETFNRLYTEIQNLPRAAKEIMLLALNGLKNPEIADELNISVNTVKTQKKLAYQKLKASLRPVEFAVLLCF